MAPLPPPPPDPQLEQHPFLPLLLRATEGYYVQEFYSM